MTFVRLPYLCTMLVLLKGHTCFARTVSHEDLLRSYKLLHVAFFVHMFPTHYGERYMTLNMHSLLHLPKCVNELRAIMGILMFSI